MKKAVSFCIAALVSLITLQVSAQQNEKIVKLINGNKPYRYSWNDFCVKGRNDLSFSRGKSQIIIGFANIPSASLKDSLRIAGLTLTAYAGNNNFYALVRDQHRLESWYAHQGIIGVYVPTPSDKWTPQLYQQGPMNQASFNVWIEWMDAADTAMLNGLNGVLAIESSKEGITAATVSAAALQWLIKQQEVVLIRPRSTEFTQLNYGGRVNGRMGSIHTTPAHGLLGNGITIGLGDGGYIDFHKDYQSRVTRAARTALPGWINHSCHIAGTLIGAGVLTENLTGMAPKAHLVTDVMNKMVNNPRFYYQNYGVVITSNSYTLGSSSLCSRLGLYDPNCRDLDRSIRSVPQVSHVFAVGNSGTISCTGYVAGYGTIADGYQSAKNAISVGVVGENDAYWNSSSKGPTKDGRIKPDMVGVGMFVYSTIPTFNVAGYTGSSHSAPHVASGLALVYEKYKLMNNGENPHSDLVKALALNNAQDLGNAGPDFVYGFGRLHVENTLDALSNNRYQIGNLNHGDSATFSITVSAGTSELKYLLYWHDTTAPTSVTQILVNDLDLVMYDPSGNAWYPWVLDTTKNRVNLAATRGADHINNVEQITINNPAAGVWTVRVRGYRVVYGPQRFVVTHSTKSQFLKLTSPNGGDKLIPGQSILVAFDHNGFTTGNFSLEYSSNGGSSWSTVVASIPLTAYTTGFTVPSTPTTNGLVRIVHSGGSYSDASDAVFTVIGCPNLLTSNMSSCGGQVNLRWNRINGANAYEVMLLRGEDWEIVNRITDTFFTFTGLNARLTYFFTVRSVINGKVGVRGGSIGYTVSESACSNSNDAGIQAVVSPITGRKNTTSALSSSHAVKVRIKNFSNSSISNVPVYYQINGGTVVSATYSGTIAANDTFTYTFSTTANLNANGTYRVKTWTGLSGDPNKWNDTLTAVVKQLANNAITLPYNQNFEQMADTTITNNAFGINGAEELDYARTAFFGRMKTNFGPGSARSGKRALILDKQFVPVLYNQNNAYITLNLSNYTSANLILNFAFMHAGEQKNTGDSVWIRGNDNSRWIPVYSLSGNDARGTYKSVKGIAVSRLLSANSQTASSSFQIRFGQYDNKSLRFLGDSAGIFIDDIQLMDAGSNVALEQILAPATKCGNTSDSVVVKIKNLSNTTQSNFLVFYSIDGNSAVRDTFTSSLNADAESNFIFTVKTGVLATGLHSIKVWTALSGDGDRTNDTLTQTFRLIDKIASLPYYDGFEDAKQKFFAEGPYNSWEWGTPNSYLTTRAANGNKVWTTGLTDNYRNNDRGFLYTPCFDLSGTDTSLKLTFNMMYDIEDFTDTLRIEYSTNGTTWTRLGAKNQGFNWYTNIRHFFDGVGGRLKYSVSGINVPVDFMPDKTNVRFRFVFASDQYDTYDGPVLDDFHLFGGSAGVYTGNTITATATGTGAGWTDFKQGNQMIMSISDSSNAIGSTNAGVYTRTGSLRNYNGQVTMNRNWWVDPGNSNAGNYRIRLYFTATEAEDLINADPYIRAISDFGVTKYAGGSEDSLFTNNDKDPSKYTFFAPQHTIVPYFNGYYLEFNIQSFSEFWINSGDSSRLTPLPVDFIHVNARKQESFTLVEWAIAQNCTQGVFTVFECDAQGNIQREVEQLDALCGSGFYRIRDFGARKGNTFYKIKFVGENNETLFSPLFMARGEVSNQPAISVFPNPSNGMVKLQNNLWMGTTKVSVSDASGRVVWQDAIQMEAGKTTPINLQTLGDGMYFLQLENQGEIKNTRLIIRR